MDLFSDVLCWLISIVYAMEVTTYKCNDLEFLVINIKMSQLMLNFGHCICKCTNIERLK